MSHFGMWISLSWRQLKPFRLMGKFHLSLKEFNFGALFIIRVITRDNFLCPIYRAGQTSNYWTSALPFVLPMTFLLSEAPRCLASSLTRNVTYTCGGETILWRNCCQTLELNWSQTLEIASHKSPSVYLINPSPIAPDMPVLRTGRCSVPGKHVRHFFLIWLGQVTLQNQ